MGTEVLRSELMKEPGTTIPLSTGGFLEKITFQNHSTKTLALKAKMFLLRLILTVRLNISKRGTKPNCHRIISTLYFQQCSCIFFPRFKKNY